MTNKLLGWHFLQEDRRERFGDRRLIEAGKTYRVDPPIALCEKGLHASARAIDALFYAPGPIVCRVRLSGQVLRDEDKACATERTVLWLADATDVLHEFAVWCAERALERERAVGRDPDRRSWAALEAKRQWLRGEINEEQLAAALAAARAAARDAARAAVRAAVRDAARAVHNNELTRRLLALEDAP